MFPLPTNGQADRPSDAEIDAAIAGDPDWADVEPIDWTKAEVVTPPKAPPAPKTAAAR